MKTKIKQQGTMKRAKSPLITALLTAHCSLLIVLSTCTNIVDTPNPETTLPPGYGSFTLQMAETTSRTILPDSPLWSGFTRFELSFEPAASGGVGNAQSDSDTQTPPAAAGTALDPVLLYPGKYDIFVEAYTGSNVVARGTALDVTIAEGQNTNSSITLKAVFADPGSNGYTGTFDWDVTLNTATVTVTSAEMTILQGGSPVGAAVTLSSGSNANTRTLPVGVYTVKFEMDGTENSGTEHKAFVWYELLYVYENLISEYTETFTDAHFSRTHWNVTLIYDHDALGNVALGTGMQSVIHGDKIAASTPGNVIPVPSFPKHRFDDWFTNTACTDPWDIANDPVHDDLTLYALWAPNTATLTLTLDQIEKDDPTYSGSGITISRTGPTPSQTFTVTVSSPGDYASFLWEIDGSGIYAAVTQTTGSSFILNGANNNYNTYGGHSLRLTVTKTVNAQTLTYMVSIPFTVVN